MPDRCASSTATLGEVLESAYWLDRAISRRLIPVESGVPMLQRLREHTADIESLIAVLPKGKHDLRKSLLRHRWSGPGTGACRDGV
jgi:hypothetical protein